MMVNNKVFAGWQQPEWKDVRFDDNFSVSYRLVDESIILIQGRGYSNYDAERRSVAFGRKLIAEHIPINRDYVMIQDWSEYENSSSRARQYFIDSLVNDTRLAGIVFCNISLKQAMSIRLATTLKIIKVQGAIEQDLPHALDRARNMLSSGTGGVPGKNNFFRWPRFPKWLNRYLSRKYINDLLAYLETIDWETGQSKKKLRIDSNHPMMPVFDAISFIKSQLDKTFKERNRIEQDLIRHREDLEILVSERTAALKASEKQLKLILEHSPISIAVVDDTYHLIFLNRELVRTFGWSREKIYSPSHFARVIIDEDQDVEKRFMAWADHLLGAFGRQFGPAEYEIKCKDGKVRPVEITATSIGDKILILMNDITERKATEARLAELAIRDELTGLFNRRHFMTQLDRELERFCRYSLPVSLMLFDIDFFKQVNDTYGHPAGDKVLADLARLTCRTFRGIDTIFRLGGEEFAVILPETSLANAEIAAIRFKNAVAEAVFHTGDTDVSITVSIGIAMASEQGDLKHDFLKHADDALYVAKNNGRNRIEIHGSCPVELDT